MDFLKKAVIPTVVIELVLIIFIFIIGYYRFKKIEDLLASIDNSNASINDKIVVITAKIDSNCSEVMKFNDDLHKFKTENILLKRKLDFQEEMFRLLLSELKSKNIDISHDKITKKLDKMKKKIDKKTKNKKKDDDDDDDYASILGKM